MADFTTVGIPENLAPGDICLVLVASGASISGIPPSFGLSLNLAATNLFFNGYLFTGTAAGGYPFQLSTPAKGSYLTLIFSGFTASGSMNGAVSNGATQIVAPSFNARNIGDWLLCAYAVDGGAVLTLPSGLVVPELSRIDTTTYSIVVGFRVLTAKGQTGTENATTDRVCNGAGMQMNLTPGANPFASSGAAAGIM